MKVLQVFSSRKLSNGVKKPPTNNHIEIEILKVTEVGERNYADNTVFSTVAKEGGGGCGWSTFTRQLSEMHKQRFSNNDFRIREQNS